MQFIDKLSVKIKTIMVTIMIFIFIILSPFIGKAVENTTKALLPGLSTTEQIETVADVVDFNKLESETKLAEQQAIIDAQNVKLAEQQAVIDAQNVNIQSTNVVVSNEAECRKLYEKNPECKPSNIIYSSKAEFDKFIEQTKENIKHGSGEDIDKYKAKYLICKDIIEKCN